AVASGERSLVDDYTIVLHPALPSPTLPDTRGRHRATKPVVHGLLLSGSSRATTKVATKIDCQGMDETRKRARTGNEDVASVSATKAPQSPHSTDAAAAATKIAEQQAELEALKESHSVVVDGLEAKIDALQAENKSLTSALQWAYAPEAIPRRHWLGLGHDEEYAQAMENLLSSMKQYIKDLRMGTLAASLRHWSKHHADGNYLGFIICHIELPKSVLDILRPVFEQSRLNHLFFWNSHHSGDMAEFTRKVLQSNNFISGAGFGEIKFSQEDVKTICDAIKSRNTEGQPIKGLVIADCFEGGIDTHTLTTILASTTSGSANEVVLNLRGNGMSSREAAIIAEFLNSNPSLSCLRLDANQFDDADAGVLASSLSSNTRLKKFPVENNRMTEDGRLAFPRAIFDVSSLSSCAASNQTCCVSVLNRYSPIRNKWSKIFAMLALSNEDSFINTALLQGVPAQLIPMILVKCNQGFANSSKDLTDIYLELTNTTRCQKHDVWDSLGERKSLNCMYNLMKSWVVPSIFV
ncbi:hypothetical protein THAOC_33980, partial [Thalassiosira oceanica]